MDEQETKKPDESETESSEDALSPEAIAKRVAALGEEDQAEALARIEEEKLAARRAQNKKGGKKSALEIAASKKLNQIGTKKAKWHEAAPAVPYETDPLLDRTVKFGDWAKKNSKAVATIGAVAALALIGGLGIFYWKERTEALASTQLSKAVEDQTGRIGDPDKESEEERPRDPRPVFKTTADRTESALAKFREIEKRYPKTGAATLARLAEASLLLDKHDAAGALAAYQDVLSSPLAKADSEVRGRALEGRGFANELLGDKDPKGLNDAIATFKELENTDVQGFKELGMYHQARVHERKGEKDRAVELLKALHARVAKPGEGHPFPYLETVADDRLRALDPTALPPKSAGALGGPGGNKLSEAQIKQMMEQFKKQQEQAQHQDHGNPTPAPEKK